VRALSRLVIVSIAQEGLVLTEATQVIALEKAKTEKKARGEFESEHSVERSGFGVRRDQVAIIFSFVIGRHQLSDRVPANTVDTAQNTSPSCVGNVKPSRHPSHAAPRLRLCGSCLLLWPAFGLNYRMTKNTYLSTVLNGTIKQNPKMKQPRAIARSVACSSPPACQATGRSNNAYPRLR
jgi:hypothetical protein